MEKNILTNEEIEDMTMEEKEDNIKKLQKELKPYYESENLDEVYDKWRDENILDICERFQNSDEFEEFVEECWKEYQEEKGLMDISNELKTLNKTEVKNGRK